MDTLGMTELIVLFFGVVLGWWYFRRPGDPFSH
jgi:hypothetical protein